MTKAFLSTWHNFEFNYDSQYHEVYYDFFVQQFPLWCDLVDTVYLIDSNGTWNWSEKDKQRLWDIKKEVVFHKSTIDGHVDAQVQSFLPQIKEEEILYMDNDCFILDRSGVEDWFMRRKNHDAVLALSPVGSIREPILKKFPYMRDRNAVSFYFNHFLITKRFFDSLGKDLDLMQYHPFPEGTYIKELDYKTKKDDWCEHNGKLIYQLLAYADWVEMPIYPRQGFHHLHSVSMAYLLLSWKKHGYEGYETFVREQPMEKFLKILNWFQIIDVENRFTKEIQSVIEDLLRNRV